MKEKQMKYEVEIDKLRLEARKVQIAQSSSSNGSLDDVEEMIR